MLSWNLLLLLSLSLLLKIHAVPTNITIDDTDYEYFTFPSSSSTDGWEAASTAHPCASCSAQPGLNSTQAAEIFNKTWHDGHRGSVGSFTFNGSASAIYIYGIDIGQSANISFSFDDASSPTFHQSSLDSLQALVFNSLFFSATGLTVSGAGSSNVSHTVRWVLHNTTDGGMSALFDYAVVTLDLDPPPPVSGATVTATSTPTTPPVLPGTSDSDSDHAHSRATPNLGAILGGTLGGVAILIFAAIALLMLRRRRIRRRIPPSQMVFAKGKNRNRRSTALWGGSQLNALRRVGGRKRDSDLQGLNPSDSLMDTGGNLNDSDVAHTPPLPVLTPNRLAPRARTDSFEDAYTSKSGGGGSRGSGSASSQIVNEMIERQALALQNRKSRLALRGGRGS
ncbi:hypothetical protein C8F01DRAFT_1167746 [Mycena amicta]|nr:hypothetical protein C8F01DRAFT_1167746 [Mycena amicta]